MLKGGFIAWAQMGDANASIPTPQPVLPRPMFGAAPAVAAATSVTFVAPGRARVGPRSPTSALGSRLVAGAATPVAHQGRHARERRRCPDVRVDADTFAVTIDGELVEAEPATELPMAQRYFLF